MFGKSKNMNKENTELFHPLQIPEPYETSIAETKQINKIDTIIGEGTRLEGTLHCETLLRIDGIIEGDVIGENKVVVSGTGLIKGNITADCLTLGGELTGNAEIKDKTEILATGKLFGDIKTNVLIMDENALLDGKCSMPGSREKLKSETFSGF